MQRSLSTLLLRGRDRARALIAFSRFSPSLLPFARGLSPSSLSRGFPAGKKIICCIASACSVGMQRGEVKERGKEK